MLFVTGLMAFMMDAQKDLPEDMGESFPYPGPCDRTKASIVMPWWECSIAVSEVAVWYGAVLTSPGGVMWQVPGPGCYRAGFVSVRDYRLPVPYCEFQAREYEFL